MEGTCIISGQDAIEVSGKDDRVDLGSDFDTRVEVVCNGATCISRSLKKDEPLRAECFQ